MRGESRGGREVVAARCFRQVAQCALAEAERQFEGEQAGEPKHAHPGDIGDRVHARAARSGQRASEQEHAKHARGLQNAPARALFVGAASKASHDEVEQQ